MSILRTIRVLVVDEYALSRQGLALLLSMQPDFEVVGEAADGLEAEKMVAEVQPDVVLMSMTFPNTGGTQATRRIKRRFAHVTVIMLAERSDQEALLEAILAGADGYLSRRVTSAELLRLLRGVFDEQGLTAPSITERTLMEYRRLTAETVAAHPSLAHLTPREREVLQLISARATDREIAQRLHLSPHTAKRHVSSILAKLNVTSRREAARLAQPAATPRGSEPPPPLMKT